MSATSRLPLLLAALAVPGVASAQVVDGTLDAVFYGAPLAVQSTGTGFGNNTDPAVGTANGSELAVAYGRVDGGNLFLLLTGNLESNFNKINVFIDSGPGGQNTLRGDNPDVDFNSLNRLGADDASPGLTFDTGFAANFFFGAGGDGTDLFANFAQILTDGGGNGFFLGQTGYASDGTLTGGDSQGIRFTVNNSNILGVTEASAAGALTAVTGIEIAIPLATLGDPTQDLRVSAFVSSGDRGFLSNQFLGGLPDGTDNLGEPRDVNLAQFGGEQFFTVVIPEPATAGLLAIGGLTLLRRRCR